MSEKIDETMVPGPERMSVSKVERLRVKTFSAITEALLAHREELEALGAEHCDHCISFERTGMLDATTTLLVGPQPTALDRLSDGLGAALRSPELSAMLQALMAAVMKGTGPIIEVPQAAVGHQVPPPPTSAPDSAQAFTSRVIENIVDLEIPDDHIEALRGGLEAILGARASMRAAASNPV